MASVMDTLWTTTVTQVAALNLLSPVDGTTVIPVVRKKLSRAERVLDPVVQIIVFRPETPEKVRQMAFGANWYTYSFIVAITYPGNQDLVSNLTTYSTHRDSIKALFGSFTTYPVFGVAGVFDMRVRPDVFLPRSMIAINYDYQAVGVDFTATS